MFKLFFSLFFAWSLLSQRHFYCSVLHCHPLVAPKCDGIKITGCTQADTKQMRPVKLTKTTAAELYDERKNMNDDRQQIPTTDVSAADAEVKIADAIRAEQSALTDLLAKYRAYSKLRSKLRHATLETDQFAVAEVEPQFKLAETEYQQAREAAGEAIMVTWRALAAAKQPSPAPLDAGVLKADQLAEEFAALREPPFIMDTLNPLVDIKTPQSFIYVETPLLSITGSEERPPMTTNEKEALDRFALELELMLQKRDAPPKAQ